MKFSIKRDLLLKSLGFVQGVVEKKNTLPILSNVLIEAKAGKLSILATDLDIFFYDEVSKLEITSEGSTTTSASILYDILRKISSNSNVTFDLKTENKLSLNAEKSDFNLLCLPTENFPTFSNNFTGESFQIENKKFLSLLNKVRISISSDDTRHYLNGIFFHTNDVNGASFLTGVATDSHRLSSSRIKIDNSNEFSSFILPRKTVYQLTSLLSEINDDVKITISDNKVLFQIGNTKLITKVIDGKFPDYKKVVPQANTNSLIVPCKEFINSIERVTSVSLDRKEGVKLSISKNNVKLSVNSTNSGDGNEVIKANYSGEDLTISFNSKYLLDIASEIDDSELKINLKDPISPVLIEDKSDNDSFYVVMPMKI